MLADNSQAAAVVAEHALPANPVRRARVRLPQKRKREDSGNFTETPDVEVADDNSFMFTVRESDSATATSVVTAPGVEDERSLLESGSIVAKNTLFRLRNFLKLPKARRWLICEFFYPDVDNQIFLTPETEFAECLRETFPSLNSRTLRKVEWQLIRRLIGKPRRFSDAFLMEERIVLGQKRDKLRAIYSGKLTSLFEDQNEDLEIPPHIPAPLAVGSEVVVRLLEPKDGLFVGTIEMIDSEHKTYRVNFEKDFIPPLLVPDTAVASAKPPELMRTRELVDQNRLVGPRFFDSIDATASTSAPGSRTVTESQRLRDFYFSVMTGKSHVADTVQISSSLLTDIDRFGQFPTKLLLVLVKLSKLLKTKQTYLSQLREMNDTALRLNLMAEGYPWEFQQRYAQILLNLESLNDTLTEDLTALNSQQTSAGAGAGGTSPSASDDHKKRWSLARAAHLTHQISTNLGVGNLSPSCLHLVSSLTTLLLQVTKDSDPCRDMQRGIADSIHPGNIEHLQDSAVVHLLHLRQMSRGRSGSGE